MQCVKGLVNISAYKGNIQSDRKIYLVSHYALHEQHYKYELGNM